MSTIKSSAENLTLNADGSNNDIIFQSNGSNIATLDQAGLLTATSFAGSGANLTGLSSFDPDGAVVINESGADVDFRIESDGNANMIFVDGGNNKVGIGTASPAKPLHVAATSGFTARFESSATETGIEIYNSTNSHIGYLGFSDPQDNSGGWKYNHSTNKLYSRVNGSDQGLSIDSTGAVTMPKQPAFQVMMNAPQANVPINQWNDIEFDTEMFDLNADFNTTNYTFTAPVTGKYQLNFVCRGDQIDTAAMYHHFRMNTSNQLYYSIMDFGLGGTDPIYWTFNIAVLADMDAADTAKMEVYQAAGTAQMDLEHSFTYFSGYLVA